MADVAARIDAKVDRTGDHHVWAGAKKADGVGVIKIAGRIVTVRRAAWELVHGPLPSGSKVKGCTEERACVRVDHLSLDGDSRAAEEASPGPAKVRATYGSGSKREIRPGVWKLTVTTGTHDDRSTRRSFKTARAANANEAAGELAAFATEVRNSGPAPKKSLRELTVDDAMELFLDEHLAGEKGREQKTIDDYRRLNAKWFSPYIGMRKVRHIDEAMLDKAFGRMRRAGLSRSRMNQGRSLYGPFFRWAKARQMITRNPMTEFQLPTSKQVSKERLPPEVEELSLLLNKAVVVIPDIAPLLVLGAVTGMRRGELVGLRRSRIFWDELRVTVDAAIGEKRNVKGTKTRKERSFHVDLETITMLRRHCELMDERAALFGVGVSDDGYTFSLEPDCSRAMAPDYMTKRVAELKDHLGIADKKPATMALEDAALALRQQAQESRVGRTGPAPTGGMSYADIGRQLGRSERWAVLAVRSAERREAARERGSKLDFDGSILALRKFTSSELLDAGFNVTLVAQRQGHGPQVLVKHYAKGRQSADRKAAEHLGRVVHAGSTP